MAITCRAAITDGLGNFSIEYVVVQDPQDDEVLVKIKAAGLCHTDYDSLSWGKPLIIGHEGAGIVETARASVQRARPAAGNRSRVADASRARVHRAAS